MGLYKELSFVEILQPCVSFNNTWKICSRMIYEINEARDFNEALRLSYYADKIPIDIFYKVEKENFEELR